MATNIVRYLETHSAFPVVVTHPATPASGDPVRFGGITGIALTDEGDGGNLATETTVDFGKFVGRFLVDDNDGTGIAPGDIIFYHDIGTGAPATSLNNTLLAADGVFGVALGTIALNGTETIEVMHLPALL